MNRPAALFVAASLLIPVSMAIAAVSTGPQPAPKAAPPATRQAGVTIPFRLVKQHIVLDVTVNGSRPLAFILDSGDTFGVIDLDVAKELNLRLTGGVEVDGIGSKAAASRQVAGATFRVPGLDGFSQPIDLAIPLRKLLSARLGENLDGIIGGQFMRQFVVEIDYNAHKVTLHDRAFNYDGPGERIPLAFDLEGQPLIRAEITPVGGKPLDGLFKLDTGAQHAIALHGPFVAEHNLPGEGVPTIEDMRTGGVAGESTGKVARLASFKIGSFTFDRPIGLFTADKSGAFASRRIQGNIGATTLMKFRVFLDYQRKTLILEKGPTFADPMDRAFSGIGVEAEGDDYRTFRVKFVQAKSAAAEAGVQAGDVISVVGDRAAATFSLSDLSDMMQKPEALRLTLDREGRKLNLTITPRTLD